MRKTYQMNDPFSSKSAIRFTVGDTSKTAVFESKRNNGILTFETDEEDFQGAIEASKNFKEKSITLIKSEKISHAAMDDDLDNEDDNEGGETTSYPEVTKFAEAKAILSGEPYNIEKTSEDLRSKEAIFNKAAELGVSFPNLK